MSKDKYPSIFLHQMEAIVLVILQTFFTVHTVLKIQGCSVMMCLDQLCTSKSI